MSPIERLRWLVEHPHVREIVVDAEEARELLKLNENYGALRYWASRVANDVRTRGLADVVLRWKARSLADALARL